MRTGVEELVKLYQTRLLDEADVPSLAKLAPSQRREHVELLIEGFLKRDRPVLSATERQQLINAILNDVTGYGPLQPLLEDPTVDEIMVQGAGSIYVERHGQLESVAVRFRDEQHAREVADRLLAFLGRKADQSCPMADGRLPDGSRVNVVVPPIAWDGTLITIRKFRQHRFTFDDLASHGLFPKRVGILLKAAIQARLNVAISGGTGSGKTTLLSALVDLISAYERLVLLEDTAEIRTTHPHVARMEGRPPSGEGTGEVTIRSLLRNALRMRPDRIIVGEVRSAEAYDMLQAMNTGHEGGWTTAHANDPNDFVKRITGMLALANTGLPEHVLRSQICALDWIVQASRLADGRRVITAVVEVLEAQDGLQLRPIYELEQVGFDGDKPITTERYASEPPVTLQRLVARGALPPGFGWPGGESA